MEYFEHVSGVACFDPGMVNFYSTQKHGELGKSYTLGFRAGNVLEITVTFEQEKDLYNALLKAMKN